jgi:hypothetical protein
VIGAWSWSEWPQTIFSGQMSSSLDAKTSRTVEVMIHIAMPAAMRRATLIFRNIADVLVLGSAGQDLVTDHQERGRDNLLGSGRGGGWHDNLARATWDAGRTAATG